MRKEAEEKLKEMEEEAKAAWKNVDELDYHLLNSYMDSEDKWKRVLGQDLYKQQNLNISPNAR